MTTSDTASDYASFTPLGRLRCIGRLAAATLRAYDLKVRSLRLYAFDTNPLYQVVTEALSTTTGERFMLRLAYPGWRTLEDLRAEAAWLEALAADTDIGAPCVIRATNGEPVLPASGCGVPQALYPTPWYATLMTWVEGRSLAHYLTPANLERMGELFARLHLHGKAWVPPQDFTTKRFEAFLSRGEPNVLFEDRTLAAFREEDRRAFTSARGWVEREYAALDRNDLRVIHCDLWHENIKVDHGRLRPFDFEDTIWGYRLHDIAMGMLDLLETVGNDRYRDLLAALRCGYERLLDWPRGNLEVLQIGRMLWKANWTARFLPENLDALSQQYGEIFRNFESTGTLRLPGQLL